ncbi:hypothetical protein FA10DRAFT_19048 [Acaromyces ingoldii]|uniref:Uncharacterized protein n=1 Tax=Acaromyces ingoldii TaxID=215250 RepID=A0A316YV86_9BASI|nr:hypothetical protein FA10DRAFT_19048 [Acaromyces ingoldii]PWN93327.1 hypothetical protein FA10DRAFT_19048 [Acaromyces ingoldii]
MMFWRRRYVDDVRVPARLLTKAGRLDFDSQERERPNEGCRTNAPLLGSGPCNEARSTSCLHACLWRASKRGRHTSELLFLLCPPLCSNLLLTSYLSPLDRTSFELIYICPADRCDLFTSRNHDLAERKRPTIIRQTTHSCPLSSGPERASPQKANV